LFVLFTFSLLSLVKINQIKFIKMEKTTRTIEEHKANIQEFANRFKLIFEEEGECGFGRECVGLTNGNNYVDYNPCNSIDYDYIKDFYNEKLYDIVPEKAYHKHSCLAVLGRGDDSIIQLSEWVDKLNELGAIIDKYETGATGIQALISGTHNYAVRIP
jgi:hypothetical protein